MNATAQASAAPRYGSKLDNRRMLAALIDLAVVGAGGAAILVAAGVLAGDGAALGAPLAGVVAGWALYYYFACESGGGQTLGKRLAGLRVVRVDGGVAGMREIAVRTALRPLDTALVGPISMLATGERRARLGDLAAGTMVVSTDAASTPASAQVRLEPLPSRPEPTAEPVEVADTEPLLDVEPEAETEPVVDVSFVETPRMEPVSDRPGPSPHPHASTDIHTLDVATPSLKELADDVAAATGVAREGQVEVEVGGPEIDVEDPDLTVRSVETVSAIDLVMGADEPADDRPPAHEPPLGA